MIATTVLPAADATQLADYLAGAGTLDAASLQADTARSLADALSRANGHARIPTLDAWLATQPADDAHALRLQLLRLEPEGKRELGSIPELPSTARPDPALGQGAGALLDTYLAYAAGI